MTFRSQLVSWRADLRALFALVTKWRCDANVLPLKLGKHLIPYVRIHLRFRERIGRFPELRRPESVNDLVQHIKLFDRRPILGILSDKLLMRNYVEERVGPGYTVPLIRVADTVEALNIATLPTRCVVKANNDSGTVFVLREQHAPVRKEMARRLRAALTRVYAQEAGEWAYSQVRPCAFAEELLEAPGGGVLDDYKFHCFNGRVHVCQWMSHQADGKRVVRLARDGRATSGANAPIGETIAEREPATWAEMVRVAEAVTAGHLYLRADLYAVAGRVYVGEITVYPASGWGSGTTHNERLPESLRGQLVIPDQGC